MTMTNENQIVKAPQAPSLPSIPRMRREVQTTIDYYFSKVEGGFLREMPTDQHRQLLVRASADLNGALRPVSMATAEMRTTRQLLAAMFTGYPNLKGDPVELTTAYALHLQDQPLFAIAEACNQVKVGSDETRRLKLTPEFPPTHVQMWQLAEAISEKFARDKAKADTVLNAKRISGPVPTPEERAAVGRHMRDLAQKLGMTTDPAKRKQPSEAELLARQADAERTMLQEYRAAGVEPYRNKHGTLCALSLMRSLGARIEKHGDRKIVVPVDQEPPPAAE